MTCDWPGKQSGYVSALESDATEAELQEKAETFKRKKAIQGKLEPVVAKDFTQAKPEEIPLIPSPATGEPGSLTPPRSFNMMFQTYVGALRDDSAVAYLRPETAQGIFINFKNVIDTGRVKVPFGIAQIGKAFRNEINPRNFTFRSREFEQMEIEYFIAPDADWQKCHRDWIDAGLAWLESIGMPRAAAQRVRPPEGEALALLQGHGRHHVQVPLRRAGAVGVRRARRLRPHAAPEVQRQVDGVLRRGREEEDTCRTSSSPRSASTASSSPRSAPATPRTRRRTTRASWRSASCCASARAWRRSRSPCSRW